MPSQAERLLCRGLFFTLLLVYNATCYNKANRCLCDWGDQQPEGPTKCIPLNETGVIQPIQKYCGLVHDGPQDGFCLIDIMIEVNNNVWTMHPHCENAAHGGLALHCSDESPFSTFTSHSGPIHTFQYCCTKTDFCNNRSLSDIQREMCEPGMTAKIKAKWVNQEPIQIDKICASLSTSSFESSPHMSMVLTIVIICVVFIAVSVFALFSWNRIVKYKLEYDRSCRRHETELNQQSFSSTPTNSNSSATHRRNGWLVAFSSAFSRRRFSQSSTAAPGTVATSLSNHPDAPLLSSNGIGHGSNGESISFSNGISQIYKPGRPNSNRNSRFPNRLFGGGSSNGPNRYPNVVIGGNHNQHSPTQFENSSTVQTGSSILPATTTTSTGNNRSQQIHSSQFNSEFSMSGSGSGRPLLGTRTIARQIQLGQLVGKGRYGEVYSGSWVGGRVAVKVFPSREQQSWAREIEIYNALTMRHKNVLTFVAADSKDTGLTTQLWLVTSFHARGSLFDFLSVETIPLRTALRLAMGVASGVAHLHMEIPGNQGKPAIAHRDLKSKNILVTSHLSACIADFGLAVKFTSSTQSLDIPFNLRVGTRRYMAPELLDGSFHHHSFDSYIAADLYAFGLVLWEILTRCYLHNDAPADDYVLPYAQWVQPDPSDEDMIEVVCRRGERPLVPRRFIDPQPDCCATHRRILTTLGRLVVELWDKDPTVRNSALHVKKTILTVQNQLREMHRSQEQKCALLNVIDPPRYGSFAPAISSAQHQAAIAELSSGTSTSGDEAEE